MPLELTGIDEDSTVRIERRHPLSTREFFDFCQANAMWRIERAADGEIIIMPPAGMETGDRNQDLITQLGVWTRRDGRGRAFDSNTGFELPNGAMRSPDAAWISKSRVATLTREQKQVFAPICPEFVVELQSPSDSLPALRRKMAEWIENGAQLAWLIQPESKTVSIYRPGAEPEHRTGIETVEGEGPVAGFVLDLRDIWAGL
ncbi:MAG TPA: Uma2 family endonuclease [Bryobacteraceae bacterium]|nr:Uma2 family endonuclease [Bryobacteraceae bacterium]